MLKGIDVSNWQGGLNPSYYSIDFCIAKATEGLDFVDAYCDGFVQNCIANGLLWGFYHFARNNDPVREANFFVDNCKGYFGQGIPVLDYEVSNADDKAWCEQFIQRVYDLTGIWCVIYMSASRCADFYGSWIPDKCGLWVAGYPYDATDWVDADMPYDCAPFSVVAMWQFTSSLSLGDGWTVDADYAYMTHDAWMLYATADNPHDDPPSEDMPSCEQLASEVVEGKWGDGWNRKSALDGAYGKGTYEHVQTIVNSMLGLEGC